MDAKIVIPRLGGPTKVAQILHIDDKPCAAQRVSNWLRRGFPMKVLVVHGDTLRAALAAVEAQQPTAPAKAESASQVAA